MGIVNLRYLKYTTNLGMKYIIKKMQLMLLAERKGGSHSNGKGHYSDEQILQTIKVNIFRRFRG